MSHEQQLDCHDASAMPADAPRANPRDTAPGMSNRPDGSNCNRDDPKGASDSIPRSVHAQVVLLVEDDALIRMDASEMLAEAGYEVIESEYGPDAVEVLQRRGIDVLVTDVGLPGMSGLELAQRALQIQPGIGIVFATGNTELSEAGDRPDAVFLCKPYDAESLAHSIRQAIGRR